MFDLASVEDERVTVRSWIESLESWNLKYDEFPEVLNIGACVLIGVGKTHTFTFLFPDESKACIVANVLHHSMKRRSDAYWGCS